MPRPLRIEYTGAVYHVTSRGTEKRTVFVEDGDRRLFLRILELVVKRHNILIHAYCLMGNHYHLLVETPEANLSRAMQHLNGFYAQKFNGRHDRVGHLFQGRFGSKLVEKEAYLLTLCRYIVLNPVRAGLVSEPSAWAWSSFRATVGREWAGRLLSVDWVLSQFHKADRGEAIRKYQRFVQAGIGGPHGLPDDWDKAAIVGSGDFVAKFDELLRPRAQVAQIRRRRRIDARPSLEELFADCGGRTDRNGRIRAACVDYGYKQVEIAAFLRLHSTTISCVMNAKR